MARDRRGCGVATTSACCRTPRSPPRHYRAARSVGSVRGDALLTLTAAMSSRVLRRRSATAAWIYAAVACGIVGIDRRGARLRARRLRRVHDGARRRGLLPDAARPHRRGVAHEVRLPLRHGRGLGTAAPALPAGVAAQGRRRRRSRRCSSSPSRPFADEIFDADGLEQALLAAALLPLVQSSENVGATALLLHSRYDLRSVYQAGSAALRLLAIVIAAPMRRDRGARRDRRRAGDLDGRDLGGRGRRAAPVPVGAREGARRGRAGRSARSSLQSSLATGVISLRTTLDPADPRRRLGHDAGRPLPHRDRRRRPASRRRARPRASSCSRSRRATGRRAARSSVLAGVRSYSKWAGAIMVVAVPVFFVAMPWLVRVVFGSEYDGAVHAARIDPDRGGDPVRPRLDEVAAGHDRAAAAADRHARARDARRDPARRSCSAPSGVRRARRSASSSRRSCSPSPGSS